MRLLYATAKAVVFLALIAGSVYSINASLDWWNERQAHNAFEEARQTVFNQSARAVTAAPERKPETSTEQKPAMSNGQFGGKTPEQVAASITVLGAFADISLGGCQATGQLESAEQNLSSASSKQNNLFTGESKSFACAKAARSDLQQYLKDVREALHSDDAATALLKDWYSTWVTDLESTGGYNRDRVNELDGKLNKLKTEVQWPG